MGRGLLDLPPARTVVVSGLWEVSEGPHWGWGGQVPKTLAVVLSASGTGVAVREPGCASLDWVPRSCSRRILL